jgi:ADP-ribose pyrophosphatase YjhB (NUDIX family)
MRSIRYQGAIIDQDHILLIRWREANPERSFWVIPGGGREPGESVESCLVREMREETSLVVHVEKLLFEEGGLDGARPWLMKTYLCRVTGGEAAPGCEPEDPQPEGYGIVDLRWFDLQDECDWGTLVTNDRITYPQLQRIRALLGYTRNEST